MKSIHLNDFVKVKLTPLGVDIYYHQYDKLIAKGINLKPLMPQIDEDGFTEFQLWRLMQLYGSYMELAMPNVFEPIEIYFNEDNQI